MRTEAESLDNASDRPTEDELLGFCHRRHLEPLGEIDGPDPAGAGLHFADRLKLLQRHAARLVDHHVLAGLHGFDGARRTVRGNGGNQDHGNLGVLKDAPAVVHLHDFGESRG